MNTAQLEDFPKLVVECKGPLRRQHRKEYEQNTMKHKYRRIIISQLDKKFPGKEGNRTRDFL